MVMKKYLDTAASEKRFQKSPMGSLCKSQDLELETEQAVNSDIDFAVSMDFLSAYNYDFANVPLINDGEFEPWDQNRWTQLMYKHTGDMQYLEMLKRPSFIQTNE